MLLGGLVTAIEIARDPPATSSWPARWRRWRPRAGRGVVCRALARGVFPDAAIKMAEVGESTGALQDMLTSLADFYDEEIETDLGSWRRSNQRYHYHGPGHHSLLLARTCRVPSSRRWSGPILTVTAEAIRMHSDNRTRGDTGT